MTVLSGSTTSLRFGQVVKQRERGESILIYSSYIKTFLLTTYKMRNTWLGYRILLFNNFMRNLFQYCNQWLLVRGSNNARVLPFEMARQSITQWKRLLQVLEINRERECEREWDRPRLGLNLIHHEHNRSIYNHATASYLYGLFKTYLLYMLIHTQSNITKQCKSTPQIKQPKKKKKKLGIVVHKNCCIFEGKL